MKRVNAPVPDYSDNDSGEFHYVSTANESQMEISVRNFH